MEKPRLSFWQIWNMSFGFLGIQIGFALQNANVSRIFQTLGAEIDSLPILWIAAPTTGLIVQPIIGYMSDRTWCFLGRRRPYFFIGAILASLALFIMPNSSFLWIAAGMLWILDASINISMEPFRALVADLLPSDQRTMGFAVQSFLIGTGAVAASCLPYAFANWFNVPNTAPEGQVPPSVMYSFYIGGIVFFSAVAWTVYSTKEYPPENLEEFKKEKADKIGFKDGIHELADAMVKMPKTMIQLAFVQFFSWFALFTMWIYTTPAVTKHLYKTDIPTSELYNQGANWVGVLFSYYNLFAAIAAIFLPAIAKALGRRQTHAIALVLGSIGFASFYFVQGIYTPCLGKDPTYLIFSEIGIGIAWCSILAMPYAILAGALPAQRMGLYMGIFNFFIVIPQICAAGILGSIVKYCFEKEAIYALLIASASWIIAACLVLFVNDVDEKKSMEQSKAV